MIKITNLLNVYNNIALKESYHDEAVVNNVNKLGDYLIANGTTELNQAQVEQFKFSVSYEEINNEDLSEIAFYIINA